MHISFVIVKKSSNFKEKQPINLNTPHSGITQNPYNGRSAIQFSTPDATWSSNAPWGVVKPLKNVFYFLKGRGPLKIFLKSAEMLTI